MKKRLFKSISVAVSICLLITAFSGISTTTAAGEESGGVFGKGITLADVAAGLATPEDLYGEIAPETVPAAVGLDIARERTHVRRLYEDEGENLNQVVFQNADGTKTLYFFDYPVKYVNGAGKTSDISLEIVKDDTKQGYFKNAAHSLTPVGLGVVAAVEDIDCHQSQQCHSHREPVEINQAAIAKSLAQRLDDKLTRERADVDHSIENGKSSCTILLVGLLGHAAANDALDERATHHQHHQDWHNGIAVAACGKARKEGFVAILHQPCGLQARGQQCQARIANSEQRKGQQHRLAKAYAVGISTRKGGQKVEQRCIQTADNTRLDIAETQNVAQVERNYHKDAIVGRPLEHLGHIGYPKGLREFHFFLFCHLYLFGL